jgi:hypothetical protein
MIQPAEADLYTGKFEIDRREEEFLRKQAEMSGVDNWKIKKIYSKTFGLLF